MTPRHDQATLRRPIAVADVVTLGMSQVQGEQMEGWGIQSGRRRVIFTDRLFA